MRKNKLHLFLGFVLVICTSLQGQERIENLNVLLGQVADTPSQSLRPTSSSQIDELKNDFFEARGIISVVNSNEAVKWERADKPVEVFQIKSPAEITLLRNAYSSLFPKIQTIILNLEDSELSDNINAIAQLAEEMPQLRNILISSYFEIPENIDQNLAGFLNELFVNQVNPVTVYYYQASQPK